jgi:hypothetical protein
MSEFRSRKPAWLSAFVLACRRVRSPCDQFDKLGVTGSSPVPPIRKAAGNGGFLSPGF